MANVQPIRPTVVPFRPSAPKHPAPFAPYPAPAKYGQAISGNLDPADLHKLLAVAPFVRMTFPSEAKLMAFRQNLYKVNAQEKFRYATRREGWSSLVILRLK